VILVVVLDLALANRLLELRSRLFYIVAKRGASFIHHGHSSVTSNAWGVVSWKRHGERIGGR